MRLTKPLRAAGLLVVFAAVLTRPARLFDADSYLHVALARLLREHGFVSALPWARFSLLGRAYADKELLFHIGLVPFAKSAELGGQLALACLCAALAWSLWELGTRALGRWGMLVPLLVFCGSGSFELRALRLRPELLSISCLLWVVWALAERRYVRATCWAFAFALAHTAFHTVLGLACFYLIWVRWRERRWEWALPASCAAGVMAALLVHPQFPNNLYMFWVQNVEFFRHSAQLDIGAEFQAHSPLNLLLLDGLWLAGMICLWLARTPDTHATDDSARRMATFSWIAAAVFGALFVRMGRFSTLCMPFATLAFVFELRARSFTLTSGTAAHRALLVVCSLAVLNASATAFVNWHMAGCFDAALSGELTSLATRLPVDARVAANWDDAENYAYYAPHAHYLNVLDPVFMVVVEPSRHAHWMRVLAGADPDPVHTLTRELQSEYVAFMPNAHPQLFSQLSHDERAHLTHRGAHVLFALQP